MTAEQWVSAALGYALVGYIVGVPIAWAAEDSNKIPAGAEVAIGFSAGLLWPLTACYGILWVIARIVRALISSFAVLWSVSAGDWLVRRRMRREMPRARTVRR